MPTGDTDLPCSTISVLVMPTGDTDLPCSTISVLVMHDEWYIDETNWEGRTRSGINTSVGLTRVQRPKVCTRVSPTRVLIPTRVQFPWGWSCFYHIFRHWFGVMRAWMCSILLGDGNLPYSLFWSRDQRLHSDWLKSVINLEGDNTLVITLSVSSLH